MITFAIYLSTSVSEYEFRYESRKEFIAKIKELVTDGFIPWFGDVATATNFACIVSPTYVEQEGISIAKTSKTPGYQAYTPSGLCDYYYRVYNTSNIDMEVIN